MNYSTSRALLLSVAVCLLCAATGFADVEFRNGSLIYKLDDRGNRVPDFSHAGYRAGETAIPELAAKVVVAHPASDNTEVIQAAIDQVSRLPADANGFRGAVLIPPGQYPVYGTLRIRASGVGLRGSGAGKGGTTLIAAGNDRRTLVEISGSPLAILGDPLPVADDYLPVNTTRVRLRSAHGLVSGDMVRISHACTKQWISALNMTDCGGDRHGPSWRPGSRDIHWIRQITHVEGDSITLDAPLTLALDAALSQATLVKIDTRTLVHQSGVENLRIVSTYDPDNLKDEEHAWFGVGIDHARDVWVRRVTCEHLVGSAVAAWSASSRITVEDCKNLHPVGEIGGLRRSSFFTSGQQVLMQRLYSERGLHDFAIGLAAAGPNAFVQCESFESLGESGPIDSAACGTLLDRVRIDGHSLSLRNRMFQGQGVGWASLNGVVWNSSAALIAIEKPPTAQNWAFGAHGEYSGNGSWIGSDDNVDPDSLYYAQLAARIGREQAHGRAMLLRPSVQGSRASTPAQAAEASAAARAPRMTMDQWIDHIARSHPLDCDTVGLPAAHSLENKGTATDRNEKSLLRKNSGKGKLLEIENGWLAMDGSLAIGREASVPWWNGGLRPDDVQRASPALTRFVPGRDGRGLTDDLNELASTMLAQGHISLWQHPPLWYDRRRDDHSRVQRMDGEVVAPFYETPWARSGQGIASDGLSKWDVTRVNPWYFKRLRQFATVGSERGLILFNGLYMQHSLLEAGAHYVDAPWRPANNINAVGIPEPVFFAGDKLIYVAEPFYDLSNPERKALHESYMRSVLKELENQPNVILFLSEEYTGSLEFMQFWLDVVATCKPETNSKPLIAIYATKDVTDAILADARRSSLVSIIYNRFGSEGWWYQPDGTLYAPPGGKSLSPRQWSRQLKPKSPGFLEVHRAVREYRLIHRDKPFVYQGPAQFAWAVLLGGGSLPALPSTTDPRLLQAILAMQPIETSIGLMDPSGNQLLYTESLAIDIPKGNRIQAIDMQTGRPTQTSSKLYWITSDDSSTTKSAKERNP